MQYTLCSSGSRSPQIPAPPLLLQHLGQLARAAPRALSYCQGPAVFLKSLASSSQCLQLPRCLSTCSSDSLSLPPRLPPFPSFPLYLFFLLLHLLKPKVSLLRVIIAESLIWKPSFCLQQESHNQDLGGCKMSFHHSCVKNKMFPIPSSISHLIN